MARKANPGATVTFAESYDAVLVPVIFQPWARELIRRAPPRNGDHVLDLACGTGAVTRETAKSGSLLGSLTGVDMNSDMLAVARKRAAEVELVSEWLEADAGHLPFPDNRFDLAFCQQALQFFPDSVGALKELRRVLVDDGRTAFCISRHLSENPLLRAQATALENHVGPEAGAAVRAICSLFDSDEIRALFDDAGFENVQVEVVNLRLRHPDGRAYAVSAMGGMHTGDKLSKLSEEERERCIDDFLSELGECFDGVGIQFPHISNVVTARA